MEKVKAELNDAENEKIHLQMKVESLQEDRKISYLKITELESQLTNHQTHNNKLQLQ